MWRLHFKELLSFLIFNQLSPQLSVAHVTFFALILSDEEKSSLVFCSPRTLREAGHPRKGSNKGIRRIFIIVSLHGSGGPQGKREIKNPSLEFGDPKKNLLPTRYSYQQTESLPLFLFPTLCLSPPISLSSLLFPFSLLPLSLSSSSLSPPRDQREKGEPRKWPCHPLLD